MSALHCSSDGPLRGFASPFSCSSSSRSIRLMCFHIPYVSHVRLCLLFLLFHTFSHILSLYRSTPLNVEFSTRLSVSFLVFEFLSLCPVVDASNSREEVSSSPVVSSGNSSSAPAEIKDPWMPSLDLVIPESQSKKKTVYDVLADVEDTPNDNLFFAIARDVVNTYQLTKPFLDEFMRLQKQKAKIKTKSLTDVGDESGTEAKAFTLPKITFFPFTREHESEHDDAQHMKKKQREERETKKYQERRKNVNERDIEESSTDIEKNTKKPKMLFGHGGTSRKLTYTNLLNSPIENTT